MIDKTAVCRSACKYFVNEADCARGIVGLAVAIVLQHELCHEVRFANSLNLSI